MHDVSDLCIGKPPLRWLPPSSTVADAIAELHHTTAVAVWDCSSSSKDGDVAGRVCMADVVLFLCASPGNLASPAAALQATLADLLATGPAPPVRRIDPDASVLEAVDAFLDGAHSLVVPIRDRSWRDAGEPCCCWLTVEDVVRHFLSAIALFAPTASRSVSDLGVVRPAALAVAAGDSALAALPLLRAALASHASVAVVSADGGYFPLQYLVGEISPSALCPSDVSAAAAVAALSAGDLASFLAWGGAPPEATLRAVRSRLRRRNLVGMLDLLRGRHRDAASSSSSSCWSSSASSSCSSSSSDDEDDEYDGDGKMNGRSRTSPFVGRMSRGKRSTSFYSAQRGTGMWRRPAEEAIVCRRGSSVVAVMVQATSHRATQVWVVEEDDEGRDELVGVVGMLDVLRVLRHHLPQEPPI